MSTIQCDLFNVGSQLACEDEKFRAQMPNVSVETITNLENRMDELSLKLSPLKNFILPGGSRSASLAHVARTVCRRAERVCVRLSFGLSADAASGNDEDASTQSTASVNASATPPASAALLKSTEVDPLVIRYLNRLSDYLFVLSRWLNATLAIDEPIWRPHAAPPKFDREESNSQDPSEQKS